MPAGPAILPPAAAPNFAGTLFRMSRNGASMMPEHSVTVLDIVERGMMLMVHNVSVRWTDLRPYATTTRRQDAGGAICGDGDDVHRMATCRRQPDVDHNEAETETRCGRRQGAGDDEMQVRTDVIGDEYPRSLLARPNIRWQHPRRPERGTAAGPPLSVGGCIPKAIASTGFHHLSPWPFSSLTATFSAGASLIRLQAQTPPPGWPSVPSGMRIGGPRQAQADRVDRSNSVLPLTVRLVRWPPR
jgi:hypothetical protein